MTNLVNNLTKYTIALGIVISISLLFDKTFKFFFPCKGHKKIVYPDYGKEKRAEFYKDLRVEQTHRRACGDRYFIYSLIFSCFSLAIAWILRRRFLRAGFISAALLIFVKGFIFFGRGHNIDNRVMFAAIVLIILIIAISVYAIGKKRLK